MESTQPVLDVAHPALRAIVAFGGAPRPTTIVFGLFAAFSGYAAVFALSDLMDCKVDCEKLGGYSGKQECFDLDSVGLRRPIAWGTTAYRAALGLVALWGVLALGFAFLLHPICSTLAAGIVLLVIPGTKWLWDQQTKSAILFFNRACFYPLAVFVVAGILVLV